jgi:hypothetical protein
VATVAGGIVRLLGPGQEAMIAGALARARAAGVPEEMIERAVEQATAGHGGFVPGLVAGRLDALTRQRLQEGRQE